MRRVRHLSDNGHSKWRWLAGALVLTAILSLQAGCGKQENAQPEQVKKLGDGDTPILISDSSSPVPTPAGNAAAAKAGAGQAIWMQAHVAFNGMGNNNATKPTELYPNYSMFNGADISVDGMPPVTICTASQNCEMKIWYSGDGNQPKIKFHFNPHPTGSQHVFELGSEQETFDTWTGYSNGGMTITDMVTGRITKVEVNANGIPYTPTMTCTITLHTN